jgi:hypothetical protein
VWCVQKHRAPGVIRRRSRFSRPPCRADFRHRRMPPSDSWLFVVCLAALTAAAPSDKSTVCTLVATPAIFSGECAGGSARCGVLEVLPISEVRCALRGLRGGSYEQRIVRDSDSNCADNLHDSSPELFADAVEFVRAAAGENDCLHDEELARRLQEEENLRAAIISPHRRLSTERVSIDSPPYTVPRGLLGLGRAIISGAGRVLGMGPGAQRAALSERGLFDSGDELLGADRSAGQIASRRRAAVLADWVRRSEGGGAEPGDAGVRAGEGRGAEPATDEEIARRLQVLSAPTRPGAAERAAAAAAAPPSRARGGRCRSRRSPWRRGARRSPDAPPPPRPKTDSTQRRARPAAGERASGRLPTETARGGCAVPQPSRRARRAPVAGRRGLPPTGARVQAGVHARDGPPRPSAALRRFEDLSYEELLALEERLGAVSKCVLVLVLIPGLLRCALSHLSLGAQRPACAPDTPRHREREQLALSRAGDAR